MYGFYFFNLAAFSSKKIASMVTNIILKYYFILTQKLKINMSIIKH